MATVWLTTWDVAQRAGVTPERVRQWVREGKLDAERQGPTKGGYLIRVFREEDVEAFLAARAQRRAAG